MAEFESIQTRHLTLATPQTAKETTQESTGRFSKRILETQQSKMLSPVFLSE